MAHGKPVVATVGRRPARPRRRRRDRARRPAARSGRAAGGARPAARGPELCARASAPPAASGCASTSRGRPRRTRRSRRTRTRSKPSRRRPRASISRLSVDRGSRLASLSRSLRTSTAACAVFWLSRHRVALRTDGSGNRRQPGFQLRPRQGARRSHGDRRPNPPRGGRCAGIADVAYLEGHYYAAKAPGLAFVTLPAYLGLRSLGMRTERRSDEHALGARSVGMRFRSP